MNYEIKNAHEISNYSRLEFWEDIYIDDYEFEADSDAEAFEKAEAMQAAHDAELIKRHPELENFDFDCPCYVANIYKDDKKIDL